MATDTLFLLIRHAQSTWNEAGIWQGHGDPPLSETGRGQAEALAKELDEEPVDALFSSDLARARETAAILAACWGVSVREDARLRELDVGQWTGLSRGEIETRDPALLARFEGGDPDARPGGGESRAEIRTRVRDVVTELDRVHAGQRVALVTHLGVIRALAPGAEPANAECQWALLSALREGWQGAPLAEGASAL